MLPMLRYSLVVSQLDRVQVLILAKACGRVVVTRLKFGVFAKGSLVSFSTNDHITPTKPTRTRKLIEYFA